MFDSLFSRSQAGGFLSRERQDLKLLLENLENRDVPAVIGGIVYNDANCNGLLDATERGIANSTLQLYDLSNRLISTAVSDSGGNYRFTTRIGQNPGPGQVSYEVNFQQVRTNTSRTGALTLFDSSLGDLTSVEIIAEGAVSSNVVMENLEGEAYNMEAELKSTIRFQVGSTTLTASPERTITGMLGGFDGNADLQGSSARDFGATVLNGNFNRVVLTNPGDMSQFIASSAGASMSISENVSATSCACGSGNLLAMIRSTAMGKVKVIYHYQPSNGIEPGTYKIVQTPQPGGFMDGKESKNNVVIQGSDRTDYITVGVVNRSDQLLTNNFGEVRATSAVSGTVYHDVNKNGRYDGGDRALSGVTMYLTGVDMCGNQVNRTTMTGGNGSYGFSGLVQGTYTVRETQPSGYLQGTNTAGSQGGQVNVIARDTIRLVLPPDTHATNYNFGEITQTATPPSPPITTPPTWNPGKTFFFGGFGGGGFTW